MLGGFLQGQDVELSEGGLAGDGVEDGLQVAPQLDVPGANSKFDENYDMAAVATIDR